MDFGYKFLKFLQFVCTLKLNHVFTGAEPEQNIVGAFLKRACFLDYLLTTLKTSTTS